MKIYLVGMPGSGKSALGRALAKTLNLPFMDTDEELTKKYNKTPEEIILDQGEIVLREAERELLNQVLKEEDLLVATGGGFPIFNEIMDRLNENGLTIYLSYTYETLWSRLEESYDRPLIGSKEDLKKVLEKRSLIYNKATLLFRGKEEFLDNVLALESLILSLVKIGEI